MTSWSWISIASDGREVFGELELQNDPVPLKVTQRQRYDFPRDLVQIQQLECQLLVAEQGTKPCDHIRGAVAIANRPPRRFARALKIRRIGVQHPKACTGVGDDAREGLVDLMCDRRRKHSEGRDSCNLRKFRSGPVESFFRHSARRYILNRCDVLQLAILVSDRMPDCMQISDRAVRHHQTVPPLKILAVGWCLVEHIRFLDQTDVFRMDSSSGQFERHGHADLKFVDAIELL